MVGVLERTTYKYFLKKTHSNSVHIDLQQSRGSSSRNFYACLTNWDAWYMEHNTGIF